MIILVDVDNVVADLVSEWVRLYNIDFNDNLKVEDITEWDMTKFVSDECGTRIYDYLKLDSLYDRVEPIPHARDGVLTLREMGHRVVFASAGVWSSAKYRWLERHDFNTGVFASDYIVAYDKSLLHGDLLIDDGFHNIKNFGSQNSILFTQPWNRKEKWSNRADSWKDILRMYFV